MPHRIFRLIVLVASMIAAGSTAIAGGSAYSLIGIGELSLSPVGRSMGLGSMSAALWSTSSMLPDNPASWSAIKYLRIQGTFGYENISTNSANDHALFSSGDVHGLSVAVPLFPADGITLGIGFKPLSTVRYALDFGLQNVNDSTTYKTNYTGTGGLSTFFIGSSFAPATWLSLGACLEYNFGAITRGVEVLFNSSSQFNHSSIAERYSPDGFDAKIAAMVVVDKFTLGVNARLPTTLHTDVRQMYSATTFGAKDTTVSSAYEQGMPLAISAGATYRAGDYLLAAEFGTENWGSVVVNGTHPPELQSSNIISAGIERLPISGGTGFDKWSIRFGGVNRISYVIVNGNSINETFITAGVGFPVSPQSTLDIALQYGARGTINNGLLRENVFRLNGTFSINEQWLQRRE